MQNTFTTSGAGTEGHGMAGVHAPKLVSKNFQLIDLLMNTKGVCEMSVGVE